MVADHESTTVALVVATLDVAVLKRASVSATDPTVTEPNVGVDVEPILCGRDKVTAPVEALATT